MLEKGLNVANKENRLTSWELFPAPQHTAVKQGEFVTLRLFLAYLQPHFVVVYTTQTIFVCIARSQDKFREAQHRKVVSGQGQHDA